MCTVRQVRTNTPLQALALLNDMPYVEAARRLGRAGAACEGSRAPTSGSTLAFRLATAREPQPRELAILRAGFERHLAEYRRHPRGRGEAAGRGRVARGNTSNSIRRELAAYTVMASVILNLDETITKE